MKTVVYAGVIGILAAGCTVKANSPTTAAPVTGGGAYLSIVTHLPHESGDDEGANSEPAANTVLMSWSMAEIKGKFKETASKEVDPETGKVVRWKGILLSQLLEKAMESLPPERKALVDLILVKGADGRQAFIPRAFVVKYPILLAYSGSVATDLGSRGPLYSVVPWTTHERKLREEAAPLESFFIPSVESVALTNYRLRFGAVYLKKRTDPSAVRGERVFVQSCVGCHSESRKPMVTARGQAAFRHPEVKGVPALSERDRRALFQYIEAYLLENPALMAQRENQ
jgi:mono/diheme cytochrome c family protein